MRERRLLERVAAWDASEKRTHQTQIEQLVRSVIHHLTRLLNTRQGGAQIDPDLGVPDFTNFVGTTAVGSTRDIAEEIRRMVLQYEPRLQAPRVTLNREETDVLSIHFSLEGRLEVDGGEIPLQLFAKVDASGRVSVG